VTSACPSRVSMVVANLGIHSGAGEREESIGVVTIEPKAFTGPLSHLKVRPKRRSESGKMIQKNNVPKRGWPERHSYIDIILRFARFHKKSASILEFTA